MKRQVPLFLVFVFGMFMTFQFFVPHESSEWIYEYLLDWIYIIGIFALALGIWSLVRVSLEKIKTRKPNWAYSYITLAGLFVMIIFGFTARTGDSWGWYFVFVLAVLTTILMLAKMVITPGRSVLYLALAGASLSVSIVVAIFDDSWALYFYTAEGLANPMFVAFFDHVMMPILSTMFALLAFFIASAAYRAFRARNLLSSLLLLAAIIVMMRFFPYFGPTIGLFLSQLSNWLMNVPNLAAQRAIIIGIGLGIVATSLKVVLGIERGYMGKG